MHFIGAIRHTQHPRVAEQGGEREVVGHAGAAVDLDGLVDNGLGHAGSDHFDLGNLAHGAEHAHGIHLVGSMQGQQAGLINRDPGIGDNVPVAAQVGQGLAEGRAADGSLAHEGKGPLGGADTAHAVVNPARPQSALGDLKPTAGTGDDIGQRHPHILEVHLAMAIGLVQLAEYRQHAHDLHPRRVLGHDHHGVLLVAVGVGIGQAHENEEVEIGVAGTGGPPFLAVDDHFVTFHNGGAFHIGGIRGGHIRLGHSKGGAGFAVQEWCQPAFFLLLRAVLDQHFHIAGIRRVAVEHLGGDEGVAHGFRQWRILHVGQAHAVFLIGQKQVPQPLTFRLGFQGLHDRWHGPFLTVLLQVGVVFRLSRDDVLLHEGFDFLQIFLGAGRVVEVHGRASAEISCL